MTTRKIKKRRVHKVEVLAFGIVMFLITVVPVLIGLFLLDWVEAEANEVRVVRILAELQKEKEEQTEEKYRNLNKFCY